MTRVVSLDNAEHYAWGQGCDGWHLLKHPELSVIRERVPPGVGEAAHYHRWARQLFYVLEGRAELVVDGVALSLAAGESAAVAPGQVHSLRNGGDAELHFLVISAPTSHGDRVAAETEENP